MAFVKVETIKEKLNQAGKSRALLQLAIRKILMDAHQDKLEHLVDWITDFMADAIAKGIYDNPETAPEYVLWHYALSYSAMEEIMLLNLHSHDNESEDENGHCQLHNQP